MKEKISSSPGHLLNTTQDASRYNARRQSNEGNKTASKNTDLTDLLSDIKEESSAELSRKAVDCLPHPMPDNPFSEQLSSASSNKIPKKLSDSYKGTKTENQTGLVHGFDPGRDQSFVEIYFNNTSIGDVSWVKGCDNPIVTLEPSTTNNLRRISASDLVAALTKAIDYLGPRDTE